MTYRHPQCELCQGCGMAIVWHQIGVQAWRDGVYERKRHMRSMAVACGCELGARYGWLARYRPDRHCPYPTLEVDDECTLAEKREMLLDGWCEVNFAPVTTYTNGIEQTEFR